MAQDLLLFTDENIVEQLKTAPFTLGYYTLRFYTEGGKPVKKVTGTVSEFYLYPSGGTLRDSNFDLVFYDSRFDTYRGFVPPHTQSPPFLRGDEPLAPYTSIGLGGPARLFASCTSKDELRTALGYAASAGIPVQVFAGGSNIIFADEGFDGMVVKVDLRGVTTDEGPEQIVLAAGAGEPWDPLVAGAVSRGWGGIECLSGIPGTVGATPVQNVGAYGQDVSETIVDVCAIDRTTLADVTFTGKECAFDYRRSRFKGEDKDRFIITAVRFSLRPDAGPDIRYPELQRAIAEGNSPAPLRAGAEALAAVRGTVIALRRKKSMVIDPADEDSRSVGSFFTNPVVSDAEFLRIRERCTAMIGGTAPPPPSFPAPGGVKIPAAWLVEKAGYPKGFRRGAVGISANHSLALVNRGSGGGARELLALAEEIRRGVSERFGILLAFEPEVVPYTRRQDL